MKEAKLEDEKDKNLIVIDDSKEADKKILSGQSKKGKNRIYLLIAIAIAIVMAADIFKFVSHIKQVRNVSKITKQKDKKTAKVALLNYTHKKARYEIRFFQIQHSILSGDIKKAINKVDELTQSDRASAYFLLAKALYNEGKYRLASNYFNKSILLDPTNKKIYFDLMLSYIKLHKLNKAGEILNLAISNIHDKDYILALSAMLDLYQKNYSLAIAIAKKINMDRFIGNAALNDILGTINTISGRYKAAETYFNRSLLINTNDVMAKNNLAMLYFATDKPKIALKYLPNLNNSTDTNYIKAVLYLRLNNFSDAYQLLSRFPKNWKIPKFIKIIPTPIFDEKRIENGFVNALINEKLIKSIAPLKIVQDKNPLTIAKLYNAIGISKLVIKNLRKNANWYEAVTAAKKANLYFAAGNLKKAISLLESAHKKADDDPIISFNLSLAMTKSGKAQKALDIIKKTIIRYPNFPMQYLLGDIDAFEIGRFKQAEKMRTDFEEILRKRYKNSNSDEINILKALSDAQNGKRPIFSSKKWPKLRQTISFIYNIKNKKEMLKTPYKFLNSNDYKRSLKIIEQYIKLHPKNSFLNYIKGYFLYKLKRYKEAAYALYHDTSQNNVGYHMRLGALLTLVGDYKNAYLEFYRIMFLENQSGEGYFGLGILNQIKGNKNEMLKNYKMAIDAGFMGTRYIKINAVFSSILNNKTTAQ